MNRRDFLRLAGIAPTCILAPSWLQAATSGPDWNRVLILIELQGGNDGLNAVVPYRDAQYYVLRPRIAVSRDAAIPLSEELALHPALEPLLPIWKTEEFAIVLGVGYPKPNRSHFRSIEIWETASDSDETLQQGWLTQLFTHNPPPKNFAAHGIVLGGASGPLVGDTAHIVLRDTDQFVQRAKKLSEPSPTAGNAALEHILQVQQETQRAADTLQQRLVTLPALETTFPTTPIGRQLETAARLLGARVPVAAIKVSHGSFDTHGNQRPTHDRLLGELASAVAAFRNEARRQHRWNDVLMVSYSEFGRRVAENGSAGTDHGTAAPHFILGGRVHGGFFGKQPSLSHLNDGDLIHHVDFRSVYATVARNFFGIKSYALENNFSSLDFISKI